MPRAAGYGEEMGLEMLKILGASALLLVSITTKDEW